MKILLVGLGGFVGSALRYLVGGWVQRALNNPWYPYGTLTVNLLGCLLIGLCAGWVENKDLFSPETRLFLMLGVLGGFTTYSTFGYEGFSLLRDGRFLAAGSYILLHVFLGLGAVWLGYGWAQK